MRRLTLLLLALSFSAVMGCQKATDFTSKEPTQQKAILMPQQVTLEIGVQGDALLKRYPDLVRVDRQPAGLDFYQIDWDTKPQGIVTIAHGKNSFVIEEVFGVMGTYNHDWINEGINDFDITAGINASEFISHDDARLKTYAILQKILQAGWQAFIWRDEPRLQGKIRQDYVLHDQSADGLDPNYLPTFDEWMKINSRTNWLFYVEHMYLTVSFTREHTMTDPSKPGAYLLNFNLKSEAEHYRGYVGVGSVNRTKWKELLPASLAKLPPIRAKAEAELRAKGINIDETYQDPPVPDLK
jgi:hypothetical protein